MAPACSSEVISVVEFVFSCVHSECRSSTWSLLRNRLAHCVRPIASPLLCLLKLLANVCNDCDRARLSSDVCAIEM
eukprot:38203-Eustigmatos_ZCMA.PRE.1